MALEPREMTPVNRLLWLRDELEREALVDCLREYYDDLSLPALRQMAAYWQAVHALAFAATPADEQRMDAVSGEGDECGCDDEDKGE